MGSVEAPKVGPREVAIVATPLLTLILSAVVLFRSLPALEVRPVDDAEAPAARREGWVEGGQHAGRG